ncbi:MAG: hypothetical protein ABI374_07360 [Ginsengibacter sp.]
MINQEKEPGEIYKLNSEPKISTKVSKADCLNKLTDEEKKLVTLIAQIIVGKTLRTIKESETSNLI